MKYKEMVQKIGKIWTIRIIATRKFHGPLQMVEGIEAAAIPSTIYQYKYN